MDFGLEGKVAMIAAASKGIGLATAIELAQEGCLISFCGRSEEGLEAASEEIPGEPRSYVCDVAKSEDLDWWLSETESDLGPVDILVTNTGGPPAGSFTSMTDEQWQAGVEGTLMNVVRQTRAIGPKMAERGWGRIVHITSLAAKEPSPLLPISSTIRAGIASLTKIQALEWAAQGVTVNAVLPGHTLTDRQRHLAEIRAEREGIIPEQALAKQGGEVPIGRLADPKEIAAAVVFLCSIRASYITGVNLLVDGGHTKGCS